MKASEAHNLKDDELLERIRRTREEQFALRLAGQKLSVKTKVVKREEELF